MQVEIKTAEFEFSHGRKPRGEGGWVFEASVYAGGRGTTFLGQHHVQGCRSYGDAKRAAVEHFKAEAKLIGGVSGLFINVCP